MGEASNVLPAAIDYSYDVFISYRHSPPVGPFVLNVLYDLFVGWLGEELAADPRVFLDTRRMEAGDALPRVIAGALLRSRCLLAICSPSYFKSYWCLSEWESFHEREKLCARPEALIVPVLFHAGPPVREYLAARTYADFTSYTFIDASLFATEVGLGAQRAIKKLAADVGARVRGAPPFQANWPGYTPPLVPPPAPPPGLLRLSDAAAFAAGAIS